MKKYLFIVAALAALVSVNSCTKEANIQDPAPTDGYKYTFTVVDEATKATLSNTGVAWESTDCVGMFLTGYTGYAEVNTANTPTTVVLYSKNVIPANSYAYAYYPYDKDNSDNTAAHIYLSNIQEGGSSSAMPLAGVPFKVETEAEAQSRPNGAINFMNLGAVIDFRIFSDTYKTETVDYVTFTATSKKDLDGQDTDLAVSGDGYLDLTAVKTNDESTLALLFGMGTDYNYAKVKDVNVAVADSKANASTPIYLVVAPGIYTGTITVGTDVATYTFNLSNKALGRNAIKHYNMNLDNASRVAGVVETVESLPYSEPFTTGIGEFVVEDISNADGFTIWSHSTQSGTYMKATGFESNSSRHAAESMLVSPWIDLTSVSHAYATFDHAHRFAGTVSNELTFWVLTDETSSTWQQETIPTYGSGSNWTFVNSGEIDLSAYTGNKVKIAFKYISDGTSSSTPTWEVNNVYVAEKVYTTEFTMDAASINVEVGKTKNNNVTVNSGATITYSSADGTIATVAADGTVTGVAEGTTTINVHVDANAPYPAKDGSFSVTVTPAVNYSDFTWNLAVDQTASASDSELDWYYRGMTMVVEKSSASTATNNYYPGTSGHSYTSTRFYSGSELTITPYTGCSIGYVEFTATSAGYATALGNSTWTNATATASGTTVTVEPTTKTDAFSAAISGTCGFTAVTVYYTGDLEAVQSYTLSLETVQNGTIAINGNLTEAEPSTLIELSATPADGYAFGTWDVKDGDNNDITVTNNKFTMPSSNVTVSATFLKIYTVTIASDIENGTVSATPTQAVAGTSISLSASPASGYKLDSWSVKDAQNNDVTVTSNAFTMPESNVTVSATFVSTGGVDSIVYTLTPATGSNNSYASNCDIEISGITWNVSGNSQMQPWRLGGKSISNTNRAIYSKTALGYNISKIDITHGGASSITVNSMTVIVASDADFNTVISTLTPTFAANSTVTVNRPDGVSWSNCYYKIVYNVTVSGSNNKFIEFTKAEFTGK